MTKRQGRKARQPNLEFARLLAKGVGAIANRQEKNKGVIQDEIGYALGRQGRHAPQHWEKGNVPGDEDVAYLAHICVKQGGMDKGWLLSFLQAADFPSSTPLIEQLFPPQPETADSPATRHNLPRQDYRHFVGRAAELQRVATWLDPDTRSHLLCIDGIGGIGKSALILEAAYRLLRGEPPFILNPYEAIIYVSAKQTFLTLNGIIPSADSFRTLEDLYLAIGQVLDHLDVLRAQPSQQSGLVKEILRQTQTLLIVDNLESIADKEVIAFLMRDLPHPSKAVVTTRERIYQAMPLRLKNGCPLLTYRATGRYDIKSPNCEIYKALFPEVLRLEGLRILKYADRGPTHPS